MSRQYVDISSNNGTPNLVAYRDDGHTDLMLKATQGTEYEWPQMQALARQWHSFGAQYRVGYYHWLYGTISGSEQHTFFWSQVAPVWRAGDWTMTDFEDVDPSRWVSDAQHLAVLRDFDSRCQVHGYHDIYTGNWYLANLPQCVAYLRTRPVVMSDYSNSPPANPYGLTYDAHQFTSSASVAGMQGRVDYNRWLTDSALGGGSPITSGEDTLSAAEIADLKAHISGAVTLMIKGDVDAHGIALPQGKNTHPNNLTFIRQDLASIAAALGYMIRGDLAPDGTPTAKGADTHPYNLKNAFNDLQTALTQLAQIGDAIAHVALPSGGTVDLAPVLTAIEAVPASVRQQIAAHPLAIGGTTAS